MPRVVGIDLGTITTDLCGLDHGEPFLATSLPTGDAVADPAALLSILEKAAPLDLVVGPSGYGLPITAASALTANDVRLATLGVDGESGGIPGLTALLRALAAAPYPVVLTPGVIHLPTVPAHRKVNRIDMGTADKVCACALAVHQRAGEIGGFESDVSFMFLETGGAFSAAIAVSNGTIVDGMGGSSGPIGMAAAGALDGEVAYLAGRVTKSMLFSGGARTIAGAGDDSNQAVLSPTGTRGTLAWSAYVESAVKSLAGLATSVPGVRDIVLSGRLARDLNLHDELTERLEPVIGKPMIRALDGFAPDVKQAAQGAALVADGLAGGWFAALVQTMRLREAAGTVLDHLHVISPADARRRLGLV